MQRRQRQMVVMLLMPLASCKVGRMGEQQMGDGWHGPQWWRWVWEHALARYRQQWPLTPQSPAGTNAAVLSL